MTEREWEAHRRRTNKEYARFMFWQEMDPLIAALLLIAFMALAAWLS